MGNNKTKQEKEMQNEEKKTIMESIKQKAAKVKDGLQNLALKERVKIAVKSAFYLAVSGGLFAVSSRLNRMRAPYQSREDKTFIGDANDGLQWIGSMAGFLGAIGFGIKGVDEAHTAICCSTKYITEDYMKKAKDTLEKNESAKAEEKGKEESAA